MKSKEAGHDDGRERGLGMVIRLAGHCDRARPGFAAGADVHRTSHASVRAGVRCSDRDAHGNGSNRRDRDHER